MKKFILVLGMLVSGFNACPQCICVGGPHNGNTVITHGDSTSCLATGGSIECTLPIELEDFTGSNKGSYNHLYWVTATETNNSHFVVERSRGGQYWEYLTTIAGSGTVNTPSFYEYNDYDYIDGVNYYRLIQIDYNSEADTSKIISISTQPKPIIEKPVAYDTIGRIIPDPDNYIGVIIYKYKNGFWYKVTRLR